MKSCQMYSSINSHIDDAQRETHLWHKAGGEVKDFLFRVDRQKFRPEIETEVSKRKGGGGEEEKGERGAAQGLCSPAAGS